MNKESFLYLWRDNKLAKYYLGIHKGNTDDGYVCSSKYMLSEYNKRPQDFKRRVLKFGKWEKLIKLEVKLLKSRIKRFNLDYYNNSCGGAIIYTDEIRKKMSKALKGRTFSEEIRRKLGEAQKGKTHSEETRRKMSEARKGKIISEETRRKISKGLKGKIISEETRRKMSEARKGKTHFRVFYKYKNKKYFYSELCKHLKTSGTIFKQLQQQGEIVKC